MPQPKESTVVYKKVEEALISAVRRRPDEDMTTLASEQNRKRVDPLGRAYAGSQLQLQLYVNRRQAELNHAITVALGFPPSPLTWLSPVENEAYKEYRDAAFLEKLGLEDLVTPLRAFWPRSGPRWDGLARMDSSSTVILIEAKNYPGEVRGGGCKAGDVTPVTSRHPVSRTTNARTRITEALNAAAKNIGVQNSDHWLGSLYQYANRLAHVDFLRRNGVDARMVNVCFTGDPNLRRRTTAEQWRTSSADLKKEVGFAVEAPAWLVDVVLPARDRSELVGSAS